MTMDRPVWTEGLLKSLPDLQEVLPETGDGIPARPAAADDDNPSSNKAKANLDQFFQSDAPLVIVTGDAEEPLIGNPSAGGQLISRSSLLTGGPPDTTSDQPAGNAQASLVDPDAEIAVVAAAAGPCVPMVVDITDDEIYNGGNLFDETNDGAGLSLREAIGVANSIAGADMIEFDASLNGSVFILYGEFTITDDLTIDGDITGDNTADIRITGSDTHRIFNVSGTGTDAVLLSLLLTEGRASFGGAIATGAGTTLEVRDSTFSNNIATTTGGAALGIYGGTATLYNTLITGNHSYRSAGAVYANNATVNLTNSTVHDNTADYFGGGLYLYNSSLYSFNSTLTANQADADGLSTVYGGGISSFGSTIELSNTVLAENVSGTAYTAHDTSSTINTATSSFFGTAVTVSSGSGNMINAGDPGLAALADNGGSTQTRAIEAGSDLIDAGSNPAIPAGVTMDANGNDRTIAGTVDIGATERPLVVTTELDEIADAGTLAADIADGGGLSLREALAYCGQR